MADLQKKDWLDHAREPSEIGLPDRLLLLGVAVSLGAAVLLGFLFFF